MTKKVRPIIAVIAVAYLSGCAPIEDYRRAVTRAEQAERRAADLHHRLINAEARAEVAEQHAKEADGRYWRYTAFASLTITGLLVLYQVYSMGRTSSVQNLSELKRILDEQKRLDDQNRPGIPLQPENTNSRSLSRNAERVQR